MCLYIAHCGVNRIAAGIMCTVVRCDVLCLHRSRGEQVGDVRSTGPTCFSCFSGILGHFGCLASPKMEPGAFVWPVSRTLVQIEQLDPDCWKRNVSAKWTHVVDLCEGQRTGDTLFVILAKS